MYHSIGPVGKYHNILFLSIHILSIVVVFFLLLFSACAKLREAGANLSLHILHEHCCCFPLGLV